MYIRHWTRLLALPVWLRLACVNAAFADDLAAPPFERGVLDQQELFSGLCPDYTTYARHLQ